MADLKKVTIWTDGACSKNPGPGGYGVVLCYQQHRKELSGGYRLTTSNRMELMAAIVGLRALKAACAVKLHTDSRYLADALGLGWAERWRAANWMRTPRNHASNADLWAKVLDACSPHQITAEWVPSHAGISENERCDSLATSASRQPGLPSDDGYETTLAHGPDVLLFPPDREAKSASMSSDRLCAGCGLPIPRDRLEAVPDATLCVACKRNEETEPVNPQWTGMDCPRCLREGIRSPLVWRRPCDPHISREFLGCSRFPECWYSETALPARLATDSR